MTCFALLQTGLSLTVYPPMPSTITKEWQIDQQRKMIRQGQGRVEGIASEWDYSKNTWKS